MFKVFGLMGLAAALLLAACSGSGGSGREVQITQEKTSCTPATIAVTPSEKLKLVVKNNAGKDYEVEGIEGTQLEELIVPDGRTRNVGYTVPDKPGIYKVKCYVPGDVSTIVLLQAGGTPAGGAAATSSPSSRRLGGQAPASSVVKVQMIEFRMIPDVKTVPAGKVRFEAKNISVSMVHELAVLRPKADGSFQNLGEIENLQAGASGSLTLDLSAGTYRLACLIAAGESGSPLDHYKAGMHTDIVVGEDVQAR